MLARYLIIVSSVVATFWCFDDHLQPETATSLKMLSSTKVNVGGQVKSSTRSYNDKICRDQFNRILVSAKDNELWARKVMDSWGSLPPSGHLYGRYADLGNFDECMNIGQNSEITNDVFVPQYCLAHYPLNEIYQLYSSRQPRLFVEARDPKEVVVGVCVPDSCDVQTLTDIFKNMAMQQMNLTINGDMFQEIQCTRKEDRSLTGLDIFAITIFSMVGFLIILSTMYEVLCSKTNKTKYNDVLISFSLVTNSKKLFNVQRSSASKDTIDCLHGIRSLSIIWVIYAHETMSMQFMPLMNHDALWQFISDYYSMVVISGPIAVDTFFLISGLLVTYHVYKEIERSGGMTVTSILKMYLHRYLRLFPILATTILFAVTLYKYIGDGPYWNIVNMAIEAPCRYFWWLSLLYLQNYVNSSAMCLGHTWYLSADTQLYILSPLVLIPFKRWGRKFVIAIVGLMFASCLYIFIIMMTHEFNMKLLAEDLTGDNDKKVMLYYGFHTRAPAYLVGILLGHLMYSIRKRKLNLSKLSISSGWIACFAVIAAIIWGPYEAQQRYSQPTQLQSAFFEAFSRVSWAIAIAWLIFACSQGYGGLINSFLSSPLWQPISRLSYAIYVIHLVVQFTIVGIVRTDVYFSYIEAIRSFWGGFGLMLCISPVMVLAFESPFIALEKYFLGNNTSRRQHDSKNVRPGSVETLESSLEEPSKC